MAYKPVDRSFEKSYLSEQHKTMRWLAENGLSAEEIQGMHWGNVCEVDKVVKIKREVRGVQLTQEGGVKMWHEDKEFRIALPGTVCEHFLLKSRIWCHWMFLREKPRTWRSEGSKTSLYSLPEVEEICRGAESFSENTLTNVLKFATIEISKLNITINESQRLDSRVELIEA